MYEQQTAPEACRLTGTDPQLGLSLEEASSRLAKNGPNELAQQKSKSKLVIFLGQLHDPMIYILFAAAAISLFHGEFSDALIILAVVLLNAIIGMTQESKAEAALAALMKMSSPYALVKRNGQMADIPARELVVGDIVMLDAGRIVPADLRLLTAINLKADESALTGESVPVDKDADFVAAAGTGIGDRRNMAYASTSIAYGRGEGLVTAVAMDTEIGKIAKMLDATHSDMTPLQKRLAGLGKLLGIVAIVICLLMFLLAMLQQRELTEMMMTAIALAVAAVPEGLPAVVTIVLALGVQRLVKVNTIVRRLPSVETLGAVSVVCSDKTGTLTQNKMTVSRFYHNENLLDMDALEAAKDRLLVEGFVLCSDARVENGSRTGDPTELALIDMGIAVGLTRDHLENAAPRINEWSFDSERKRMTTVHRQKDGAVIAYTKGAMDQILARCNHIHVNGQTRPITDNDHAKINEAASLMAQSALRVLGLAFKPEDADATETDMTFVGLVGMIDPPRPEAKNSVATLKRAGVTTIMITGDHRDTALAVAKTLGIADSEAQCITGGELDNMSQADLDKAVGNLRVFARVSPQHKVMIVKAFKGQGHIVSMTGDGVNDAPSLKAADIGVSMGITGTDVAKGASDMVLTDDNFSTIEKAVAEGRRIYANIRKTVLFLLSSNFGEVITMFTAVVLGMAIPLKAVHILWVNLITDSLPGLALGMDESGHDVMQEPPRKPDESLFARGGLVLTLFYGCAIAFLTLSAFLLQPIQRVGWDWQAIMTYLNVPENLQSAQTFAFVTLATSQLFHALGMRDTHRSIFRINPFSNRTMVYAFVGGLLLQVAVTEVPFLISMFNTSQLSLVQWCELLLLSLVPVAAHELVVLARFVHKRITPVS